jgi:hypothetical protein
MVYLLNHIHSFLRRGFFQRNWDTQVSKRGLIFSNMKVENSINCVQHLRRSVPTLYLTFSMVDNTPEASINESKTTLNLVSMVIEAPPIKRVSSANWEWLIFLTPRAICKPGRFPKILSF